MTQEPRVGLSISARSHGSIPDLKWVNRHLPIRDVCVALDLRFGSGGMIHCWHPDRHKNGDSTPSVSIRKSSNRLRCFGCGSTTLSVVDLVMDAQSTDVAGAARWLQEHFELKYICRGKHLKDGHAIQPYRVGHEQPVDLLIRSGLWASLDPPAQRIVPVLLCFAEGGEQSGTFEVRLSYRAIQRYSGVRSFETISNALQQLRELEWLKKVPQSNTGSSSPLREVNVYILTPYSDALMELANAAAAATRVAVEQERELRSQKRKERRRIAEATAPSSVSSPTQNPNSAALESTSLYAERSVGENGATQIVAGIATYSLFTGITQPKVFRNRLRRKSAACGRVHWRKQLARRT